MSNFIISSTDRLKEKLDLIQALLDINITHAIKVSKTESNLNELDVKYLKLNCEIKTLSADSSDAKMISTYIENGKGGYKMNLIHCFSLNRQGEENVFNPDKLNNKKLLWHGSRFSNFVGILSQGLRIAPPEAPVSGYRFGKGVYFAD
jgi:poly [ADP-ribose] polymerase